MNILWLSHLLPYPPKGGVRIRSYNLLKETCKYNNVHFIGLCQSAHQQTMNDVKIGKNDLEKFCKSVIVHPFESYHNRLTWLLLAITAFFSKTSYKVKWCKSNQLVLAIRTLLRKEKIDLVHFDTISLLQYSLLIPTTIPIVINHHNIESTMMYRRSKNQKNIAKRLYFNWEAYKLRKLELKYCVKGLNLVVSQLDKERLLKINSILKVSIIPNGVDIDYFKRITQPYISKSLIFVGGLTWYPNIDAVTYICKEIWPLIIKKEKNTKLFIIGRNPPKKLKRLVEGQDTIQLLGFVDDIRPLMSSVSGYICPMREGGGTRLKVLDALAMGVPLIGTRMSCEGIPVEDGQNVLLADTLEEFEDRIIRVFQEPKLRKKLSKNSRKLIEDQFSFTKIGNKLNNCYERLNNNDLSFSK